VSILVIAPSRGRPEQAARMAESFCATAIYPKTRLVIAVDHDDPRRDEYAIALRPRAYGYEPVTVVTLWAGETGNLVRALNGSWARFADQADIIGTVNDDMVFRTHSWDRIVSQAGPGLVFGDDLFQHEALVTSPFIDARIPRALGWYGLPLVEHQFVDNGWLELGRALGILRYLPEVVIEHLHPFADKGSWDETYERGNRQDVIDRDREAFEAWRDGPGGLAADVDRLRDLAA
jgi:hypothetical protein